MLHYDITISGNVQGVFFRKYTVDKANELGLKGFVMNKPNGDVYCEAEGTEVALKQFVQWCRTGSPLSKVKSVTVCEGEFRHLGAFGIAR